MRAHEAGALDLPTADPFLCVIGAESTGGTFLARWLEHDGWTVEHWSMPHGSHASGDRHWPTDRFGPGRFDAIFVTVRDWSCSLPSVIAHHTSDVDLAWQEHRDAYRRIFGWLPRFHRPWRVVSYDLLVHRPAETMNAITAWLGEGTDAGPPPAEVEDGNAKWLAS